MPLLKFQLKNNMIEVTVTKGCPFDLKNLYIQSHPYLYGMTNNILCYMRSTL